MMKHHDMAPILDVMDKAMADLNRITMTPDTDVVMAKLLPCISPPFKIKKMLKKEFGYTAIMEFPGSYIEPPEHWNVKWIDFDTRDICLYISFEDFKHNYTSKKDIYATEKTT